MSWRLKLSNWLSGGALDECQEQVKLAKAKVLQSESGVESLQAQLEQTRKELAQANALQQINQGVQAELGETQLRLNKIRGEHRVYRQKSQEAEKQLEQLRAKLQQTSLELASSQDWLQQVRTAVEIADIKKTLPQQEFNTLWGFGVSSPLPQTTSMAGSIIIRGWVLGKRSTVEQVRITFQGQTILEVPNNLPSYPVTQQYPDIPLAANCGFEFPLTVVGITAPAELNLVAVLSDRSDIPLCTFVLK